MGIKKLTRQWKKGKISFPSVYGVKKGFAYELIFMGDIPIPIKDKEYALKYPDKYLEKNGWKWVEWSEME